MQTNDFEQAFSSFLDSPEYDNAEDALFSAMRMAFIAGWSAARGEIPNAHENIIHLLFKPPEIEPK